MNFRPASDRMIFRPAASKSPGIPLVFLRFNLLPGRKSSWPSAHSPFHQPLLYSLKSPKKIISRPVLNKTGRLLSRGSLKRW
jgi:hypothetical protein